MGFKVLDLALTDFLEFTAAWLPLAYSEQRCQQIGLVMAYTLYARERSPNTLLCRTPTKEGEKTKSSQDPKETKLAQYTALAKEYTENHGSDLPVCRTAIYTVG